MSKQPWQGMSKDSWQKHNNEYSLYTSIRYQSIPFVLPKAESKEIPLKLKLEREIEQKILAEDLRPSHLSGSVATAFKTIFLICTLPFYLGFYLIPIYLFEKSKILIISLFKSLNNVIQKLLNPWRLGLNRLKIFKKYLTETTNSISSKLKLSLKNLLKINPFNKFNYQKIKNQILFYPSSSIQKLKNRQLLFKNRIASSLADIKKQIAKIIKSPFIYLHEKIKKTAAALYEKFALPPLKIVSNKYNWMRFKKQQIADYILQKTNQIGNKLGRFKDALFKAPFGMRHFPLKSNFSITKNNWIIQLNQKIKKLQISLAIQFKKFFIAPSKLQTYLDRPITVYREKVQRFKIFKAEARHFFIYLPTTVKMKLTRLLLILDKYNASFSTLFKKYKAYSSSCAKALKLILIQWTPQPLKNVFHTSIKRAKQIREKISQNYQQAVFLLLLGSLWLKVLIRYAKKQVTTHRYSKKLLIQND